MQNVFFGTKKTRCRNDPTVICIGFSSTKLCILHSSFCIHHSAFFVCPRADKKTTRGEGWSFHPIAARGAGISRKRQSQSGTVLPDNVHCNISAFFRQSFVSKIKGTVSNFKRRAKPVILSAQKNHMSFRASAHTGAPQGGLSCPFGAIHILGIPQIERKSNGMWDKKLGDCHTSLRTGSQ